MSDLATIIADVEGCLEIVEAEVGVHDWNDRTWHDRRRRALRTQVDRLIANHGALLLDEWNGARITLAGITATSTSGMDGAFRNWLVAARRRMVA